MMTVAEPEPGSDVAARASATPSAASSATPDSAAVASLCRRGHDGDDVPTGASTAGAGPATGPVVTGWLGSATAVGIQAAPSQRSHTVPSQYRVGSSGTHADPSQVSQRCPSQYRLGSSPMRPVTPRANARRLSIPPRRRSDRISDARLGPSTERVRTH